MSWACPGVSHGACTFPVSRMVLVLDRRTLAAKDLIAPRYADLVYEGRWWTTEREGYDAFVNVTQERVTGSVTLRLFKGTASVVGRERVRAVRRALRHLR